MCDPRLERIGYGAQERFLHEIVRAVDVAAE
jgi:hypothetical protein